MRRISILLFVGALSACAAPSWQQTSASPSNVEAILLGMARADATMCQRRGFQLGTPEFGACYRAIQNGTSPEAAATTVRR